MNWLSRDPAKKTGPAPKQNKRANNVNDLSSPTADQLPIKLPSGPAESQACTTNRKRQQLLPWHPSIWHGADFTRSKRINIQPSSALKASIYR